MLELVYPAYFLSVKCEGRSWIFKYGSVFYRGENATMELEHREQEYGLTKEKIVIALFRINAGKSGYYLANLREQKYYYCGMALEDVQATLWSLGIGRADPVGN